jgi:zinc transport system substrate-binding protein
MVLARRTRIAVVATAVVLVVTGVTYGLFLLSSSPPGTSGRLAIVASFFPVAQLTSRVAGPGVTVTTLVPTGVEPHDWEPAPGDLQKLASADLVVYIHPDFETYVPLLLSSLSSPPPSVATSEGLDLLTIQHGDEEEVDPHIWLDPILVRHQIRLIRDALIDIDPQFEDAYVARASAVEQELASLDIGIRSGLESCEIRTFIASHAAFTYFALRYNLTLESITSEPDVEPTAARIQELIDYARANNISVIYTEPLVSSGPAQVIAEEIGGTTKPLDPIESISSEDLTAGRTFFTIPWDNLVNLQAGLRCSG